MIATKRYLLITLSLAVSLIAVSQGGTTAIEIESFKPPLKRQLFHDPIDREQNSILKGAGESAKLSQNEEINFFVVKSLARNGTVDLIQYKIEKDSVIADQPKIGYLRGLERLLKTINGDLRSGLLNIVNIPKVFEAFEASLHLDKNGESIENVIAKYSYEVSNVVLRSATFNKNPGYRVSRDHVIRKYCGMYPSRVFRTLRENPEVSFLDSMIIVAGKKYPRQLYDYAAANNELGRAIQRSNDPFIREVAGMAKSTSGQLYFPFLDNIVKGRITRQDIDEVKNDNEKYYKLLVKTHLEYVNRALNQDTVLEAAALMKMMETKARSVYINVINALHNETDPVRFRIIQTLSPEELYYLIIAGDGEIYTSSYTRGVYPLMMQKVGNRGDSLLMRVAFDKYRKFIKVAAGYNTLSNFLNSFSDPERSKTLMRAFVGKLEDSRGLEDGVDVADSYASISETLKPVADEMLMNVKLNLERNQTINNKRGIIIYDLLYKLFLSADSTNNIDLTKELGIPPVYKVENESLANEKGSVVMQVFFYGDEDGQIIFEGFKRMFSSGNWKTDNSNPEFISIVSTKGKPIQIFANRPLPEETGQDSKAQAALGEYLAKQNLQPTVVIHRGHSYYAPYTIEQILPSSKIVFMGSCGGYHLINDILKNAPDAHIIASKQIGKTAINRPFFEHLMETVRNGQDISWIPFWKDLEKKISVEGFEDYIPPHKNLGAIFIKAYKMQMGDSYVEE